MLVKTEGCDKDLSLKQKEKLAKLLHHGEWECGVGEWFCGAANYADFGRVERGRNCYKAMGRLEDSRNEADRVNSFMEQQVSVFAEGESYEDRC